MSTSIHSTDDMEIKRGGYRYRVGKANPERPVAHLFRAGSDAALCSRRTDPDMENLDVVQPGHVCRQCLTVGHRDGLIQPGKDGETPYEIVCRLIEYLDKAKRAGIVDDWICSGLSAQLEKQKAQHEGRQG